MRRLSILGVVLSTTAALVATAGAAAPKRVCRLVVDAAGDTTTFVVPADEPTLDVLSADVSADDKWVTTVVRVSALDIPESGSPPMRRWSVFFSTDDGVRYVFHARQGIGGVAASVAVVSSIQGSDEGTAWSESSAQGTNPRLHLDTRLREVRISVLRRELTATTALRRGMHISHLHVISWHEHTARTPDPVSDTGGEYDGADDATSSRSYTVGTPSCLTPGS